MADLATAAALAAAAGSSADYLERAGDAPADLSRLTSLSWRSHARLRLPTVYDCDWQDSLYEFLSDLWPKVAAAHERGDERGSGVVEQGYEVLRLCLDVAPQPLLPKRSATAAAATADAELGAAASPAGAVASLPVPCVVSRTAEEVRGRQLSDEARRVAVPAVISFVSALVYHDELMSSCVEHVPEAWLRVVVAPLVEQLHGKAELVELAAAWRAAGRGSLRPAAAPPPEWEHVLQRLQQLQTAHPEVELTELAYLEQFG